MYIYIDYEGIKCHEIIEFFCNGEIESFQFVGCTPIYQGHNDMQPS